ncbi:NlpC/P60 family protein [Streptosporangium sp. NPDC023825]|uniref:aggregation-promoting factor C-terminal-like domain-containing protein n=1 Tax=Streptosporangium sp. NPDC023825 TaxID=3154909 RepID=UPI00343A8594
MANSDGNSGANDGTLLGWNSLQRSLDSLGHRIERLSGTLSQATGGRSGKSSDLLSGMRGSYPFTVPGQAGRTTPTPTFSGSGALAGTAAPAAPGAAPAAAAGRIPNGGHRSAAAGAVAAVAGAARIPNGGGVAGAVAQAAGASMLARVGNGGHVAAGAQPPGSGATYLGTMTGAAAYGVARFTGRGIGALSAYGDAKMQDMTAMELAAAMASLGQSGTAAQGRATFLNQAFGPSAAKPSNTIAIDHQDAIATALARIRTSGGMSTAASPRDYASDQAWRSLGMVVGNASYGSTDAAVSAGEIQGPRSQHRALQLGLGSIFDPKTRSYVGNAELARRMMYTATGTASPDQERLQSSLQEGGKMHYLLRNMGWGSQTTEMFTSYTAQLADLQEHGLDYRKADDLLAQASNKASPRYASARKELKDKYNWQETQFQIDKDTAALDRSGDRAVFDEYIENLKKSSKAVEDWTKFIKTFLDLPPVKAVLGMGGAISKLKDNPGAIIPWLTGGGATVPWTVPKIAGPVNPPSMGSGGAGDMSGGIGSLLGGRGLSSGGGAQTHVPPGASAVPPPLPKANEKGKGKGKGSDKRSQPSASGSAAGAVAFALAQQGKPYVWGAEGPNSFDCSGLTMAAYKSVGKDISRTTYTQIKKGTPISRDPAEWLPGDLIFPHAGHVVMWVGGNKYVHAPNKRRPVSVDSGKPSSVLAVRRMMGGGGSWRNGSGADPTAMDSSGKQKANGKPDPARPQDISGTSTDWGSNVTGSGSILGQAGAPGERELDVLSAIFAAGGDSGAGWLQSASTSTEAPTPDTESSSTSRPDPRKNKGKGGKGVGKLGKGGNPAANQRLGRQMAAGRGWDGPQWDALRKLWMRESSWNHRAVNPSSGAAGIPQALPSAHPGVVTEEWMADPKAQIQWGLNYISGRYKTPSSAWAHSQKTGWYREGAWRVKEDELATVHQGEMIVPAPEAGRIRDVLTRQDAHAGGGGGGTSWTFAPGSIVLHLGSGGSGGASPANAKSHAAALFAELEKLSRNQKIARGM